jgi:cell division protease FtsH
MKFAREDLFDVSRHVAQPSHQEKIEYFDNRLERFKKSDDFNTQIAARLFIGCSYSELVQITEKMKELIAKTPSHLVSMGLFDITHESVYFGAKEGFDLQSPEEKYKSAIHEAGHAMIAIKHLSKCRLHSISLRQNSRSYGRIVDIALVEPHILTEDESLHDITVGFGGGVAEQVFGLPEPLDINSKNGLKDFVQRPNVKGDWNNLVEIAYKIVMKRCLAAGGSYEKCSIVNGEEIVKIIQPCYEKATAIITAHKNEVKKLAERTIEKETIYADEAYAICGKKKPLCDFEKE